MGFLNSNPAGKAGEIERVPRDFNCGQPGRAALDRAEMAAYPGATDIRTRKRV